jgi:hypothetical protein
MLTWRNIVCGAVVALFVVWVLLGNWYAWRSSLPTPHDQGEIAIYTLLVAIFTGVLAVSTIGLWVAGERQLKHLADTAERQLRAYVNVKPLGINPFTPEDRIVGHVAFHNTGKVWAKNVENFIDIKHDPCGNLGEEAFTYSNFDEGKNIIGPRAEIRRGTKWVDRSAIPKDGWLYVWGTVRYNDGFRDGRVTKFCHRYPCERLIPTEGGSMIKKKHARYHGCGNEAD